MNYAENFRKDLSELRRVKGLTMEEYSKELCTSKSTLQAVMKTGQTTLETACTIYAVRLAVESQQRLTLVTKWLYPNVAKYYSSTPGAVERNIRMAAITA